MEVTDGLTSKNCGTQDIKERADLYYLMKTIDLS